MASGMASGVVRDIGRLFAHGSNLGLTEGQLLERSIERGDETCLGALVERHGPMVLGVCRHLLRDPNDVDDAFQATFLVLVKRSRDLRRRDQLGGWIYGVAVRVANRARINAARRLPREGELQEDSVADGSSAEPSSAAETSEIRRVLHDEIARLPESYRQALVLCYLEGRTHDEAARHLGWPVGTVKGRLARARDLLRERLTRRGLATATSAGALALLNASPSKAAVPASLVASTTTTALGLSSRAIAVSAGVASASPTALTLMEGAIRTMSLAQMKLAATALTAFGLFATGSAVVTHEYQQSSTAGSSTGTARVGASAGATSSASAAAPAQTREPGVPGAAAASPKPANGPGAGRGGFGVASGAAPGGTIGSGAGFGQPGTPPGLSGPGGSGTSTATVGTGSGTQSPLDSTALQTIKLAKDALADLDGRIKLGKASPSDDDYKIWSRRLLDAQLSANLPVAEAIQAAKDYVARIDKVTAHGRLLVENGRQSKNEQREDEFLLLEAKKIASNLEKAKGVVAEGFTGRGPAGIVSDPNQLEPWLSIGYNRKQVGLMRQAMKEMEDQFRVGRIYIDRVVDMSARLAHAELSNAATPAERDSAIKAYIDRAKQIEKQTAEDFEEGKATNLSLLAAKLAVLDAEALHERSQTTPKPPTEPAGRGMMGGMMGMGAAPASGSGYGGMAAAGSMPGMGGGLSGTPTPGAGKGMGSRGGGGGEGLSGPAIAPAAGMPGGGFGGGIQPGGGEEGFGGGAPAAGRGAAPALAPGGGFGDGGMMMGGEAAGPRRPTLASKVPNPADEKRNKAILEKLETPITLNFTEAPFTEVLQSLKSSLTEKGGKSISIYVDPISLELAGHTMSSTVTIEVEDLPLRTALRLLLSQLSLGYEVTDGLILIQSSPQ